MRNNIFIVPIGGSMINADILKREGWPQFSLEFWRTFYISAGRRPHC
ncbi:MAG: hypothetical protein ABSE05_15150 [Syntrophales bacterium]